jgi:hypothetical protein
MKIRVGKVHLPTRMLLLAHLKTYFVVVGALTPEAAPAAAAAAADAAVSLEPAQAVEFTVKNITVEMTTDMIEKCIYKSSLKLLKKHQWQINISR